jgi:hypothetical protein
MRTSIPFLLLLIAACGSGSGNGTNDQSDSGGGTPDGSTGGEGGGTDGSTPTDGGSGTDSAMPQPDAGKFHPGNPNGSCSAGVPMAGQPVDTSKPTAVVGKGTAASCTFDALNTAVAAGGIITFDCGGGAINIPITATLMLPIDKATVIDGGDLVTLDGQGKVEILRFDSPGYRTNDVTVTIQHLAFTNAKTNPMKPIPQAPPPCSQGFDDGEGGAIYMRDGNLVVIDSLFTMNKAAPLGPDTGGGAIYINGSKRGVLVAGCTFAGNSGSNCGAVGALNAELDVYDSLVTGNTATGHDANNNDPSMCSVMNNGQNEIGSGGNGGALYGDGDGFNVIVCGDDIENNAAGMNAFGGGIFFTSDDFSGTLSIIDSTIAGNTGGHWTVVKSGSVTNAGTAVGTNAKSITITNSKVQGYP